MLNKVEFAKVHHEYDGDPNGDKLTGNGNQVAAKTIFCSICIFLLCTRYCKMV